MAAFVIRKSIENTVFAAMAAAVPLVAAIAPNGLAVVLGATGLVLITIDRDARRLAGVPTHIKFLVAALLGWAIVTLLWAPKAIDGADGIARVSAASYFGFVVLSKASRIQADERERAMRWFLAGYFVSLALIAAQMLSSAMFGPENSLYVTFYGFEARNEAFYNRAKTILMILLPIAAFVAVRRRGWATALLAIVGCMVISIFGESIASAAGLLVIVAGIAFGGFIRSKKLWRTGAATVAIFVIAAPVLFSANALVRLSERNDVSVSIYHRAEIWGFVAAHISDKPIAGWGMQASRYMPGGSEHFRAGAERLPLHPHNAPLQIWLELGAIGAFISSCIVAAVFLACRRGRWRAGIAVSIFGSTLFVGSVSYGIWQGWWFATLWLISALATAILSNGKSAAALPPEAAHPLSKSALTT